MKEISLKHFENWKWTCNTREKPYSHRKRRLLGLLLSRVLSEKEKSFREKIAFFRTSFARKKCKNLREMIFLFTQNLTIKKKPVISFRKIRKCENFKKKQMGKFSEEKCEEKFRK